ncbi:hypothetical protein ACQSSU_20830 [Micromonospora echinospora]
MTGDPLTEVRFWAQVIEESRRTVLCAPGRADEVKALLDRHSMAGMFDVHETPEVRTDQILMLNHNTIRAVTEQAIQRATGSIMGRDANPDDAVDRQGGHGTG